jgi:glycosyltransferase involved in cell wall biosynthesis
VVAANAVAKHYGVDSVPHDVIYAPVNAGKFGNIIKEKNAHCFRVGLVANWNPLKGHEYFIRACKKVSESSPRKIHIYLAGDKLESYKDYSDSINELIDNLNLRDMVVDLGFLADIEKFYSKVDLLVLTSITEASPITVLEAMSAGIPVVATDVGGVREMLERDNDVHAGIVVPPRDIDAIANGIETIINNEQLAASMATNGQLFARNYFDIVHCVSKHESVYKSLLQ